MTTDDMVERYVRRHPPEEFAVHELAGRAHPTLTPFAGSPPQPALSGPTRETIIVPDTELTLTRSDIEAAYSEIALAAGMTSEAVREVAESLRPAGFASLHDEGAAIGEIAQSLPPELLGGMDTELTEQDAQNEIARYCTHPGATREYSDRSGTRRIEPMIDAGKVALSMAPAGRQFRRPPVEQPTERQADEIGRYVALSGGRLSGAPQYGSVALSRQERKGIGLVGDVDRLVELSESGGTTPYEGNYTSSSPGNGRYYHADFSDEEDGGVLTSDGQAVEDAVQHYLDESAKLMGQAPLSRDTGNCSYSPGPSSAWGQKQAGPWSSVYGGR